MSNKNVLRSIIRLYQELFGKITVNSVVVAVSKNCITTKFIFFCYADFFR